MAIYTVVMFSQNKKMHYCWTFLAPRRKLLHMCTRSYCQQCNPDFNSTPLKQRCFPNVSPPPLTQSSDNQPLKLRAKQKGQQAYYKILNFCFWVLITSFLPSSREGKSQGLWILGQSYLSLLSPKSERVLPVSTLYTDWLASEEVEMYAVCSDASYKSPSSSSRRSMPLCRKASFSGDSSDSRLYVISVSGVERARAASALLWMP